MQPFFQQGDEQVNGEGTPDLGAHRVGAGAVKCFDAQRLLEPFEKQFDLPATAIQLGDGQSRVSGEFADAAVAVVAGDTLVELVFGEEVQQLGEDGATFVHKVKNRQPTVAHPRGVVAELKSKKDQTVKKRRFYRAEIAVRKILTGQ